MFKNAESNSNGSIAKANCKLCSFATTKEFNVFLNMNINCKLQHKNKCLLKKLENTIYLLAFIFHVVFLIKEQHHHIRLIGFGFVRQWLFTLNFYY